MQVSSRYFTYVLLAFLLLFFTLAYLPQSFDDFSVGGGGFWMCVDYVRAGTLYGGQPYCAQTPLVYYVGYVLSAFVSPNHLIYAFWLLVVAAHIVSFVLLKRAAVHYRAYVFPVFEVLYLFAVYRFIHFITSSFSLFFTVCGFYLLYLRRSRFTSGLMFSLAVWTHMTSFLPVFSLVVCHFLLDLNLSMEGRRLTFNLSTSLKGLLKVCLPFAMVSAIFLTAYPNILTYTVYAHADELGLGLADGLSLLVGRNIMYNYAVVFLFLGIVYSVWRRYYPSRLLFLPVTALSGFLLCISFIRQNGDLRFGSHYFLPVFPFLILCLLFIYGRDRRLFSVIFVLMLVYPSIYEIEVGNPLVDLTRQGLDLEKVRSRTAVEYGLHFIPPQGGRILYEDQLASTQVFVNYSVDLDPEQIDVIPSGSKGFPIYEDPLWAPHVRTRLNITSAFNQPYGKPLTYEESQILDRLLSGQYSLIMVGPPAWFSTSKVLFEAKDFVSRNYCVVYVPNFVYMGYGRYHSSLLFSDADDCRSFKDSLGSYYRENINSLCNVSMSAVGVVTEVMEKNSIRINPECTNKPPQVPAFHPKLRSHLGVADVLISIALALAAAVFFSRFPTDTF